MYVFKIVKLVITILVLSYFLGTLWLLYSKLLTKDPFGGDASEKTFYIMYAMYTKNSFQQVIVVVYFAFTTLATVGFGDYTPKSGPERLLATFLLLLGVASFSYIMGQFVGILMGLSVVTADNEDSENLSKYLGLLGHFNKNKPLTKETTERIEQYFEYYWQHDKNYAI